MLTLPLFGLQSKGRNVGPAGKFKLTHYQRARSCSDCHLGFGVRASLTSWGVLLNDAQNVNVIALYPWLMLPVVSVIIVVLAFNFMGDGLRDAADPYS